MSPDSCYQNGRKPRIFNQQNKIQTHLQMNQFYECFKKYQAETAGLNALGAKSVRSIFKVLMEAETPLSVSQLSLKSGLTQPNTSNAVKAMRRVGLVEYERAGQVRLVSIDQKAVIRVTALFKDICNLIKNDPL